MVFKIDQAAYELMSPWIGSNTAGFITRVKRCESITCKITNSDNQEIKDSAIKVELLIQRSFYGSSFVENVSLNEEGNYRCFYVWSSRPGDYKNLTFILRAIKDNHILGETQYDVEMHRYPRSDYHTATIVLNSPT